MRSDETVHVPRRDLNLQLVVYALLAGGGGYVGATVLARFIEFRPLELAVNFAMTGCLLFPAYRVWKQSRGRERPRLVAFVGSLLTAATLIFALSWVAARSGVIS